MGVHLWSKHIWPQSTHPLLLRLTFLNSLSQSFSFLLVLSSSAHPAIHIPCLCFTHPSHYCFSTFLSPFHLSSLFYNPLLPRLVLFINSKLQRCFWHVTFPLLPIPSSALTYWALTLTYDMWKLWHMKPCAPPSFVSHIPSPFKSPFSSPILHCSFQLRHLPLTCMWCHLCSRHIFPCFFPTSPSLISSLLSY